MNKGEGKQEEQVSLALDLGARSNPPALAALCWDSLRRRAARDLSRAQFAVFTESLVHTIQRNERSVWFSWLSLSSFAKTIAEMGRAAYSFFYCSTEASDFFPCLCRADRGAGGRLRPSDAGGSLTHKALGRADVVAGWERGVWGLLASLRARDTCVVPVLAWLGQRALPPLDSLRGVDPSLSKSCSLLFSIGRAENLVN